MSGGIANQIALLGQRDNPQGPSLFRLRLSEVGGKGTMSGRFAETRHWPLQFTEAALGA
jgi:hypothetical protein